MSYCPEDGAELEVVCSHYHICYDCPACSTHWWYNGDEGYYQAVEGLITKCPAHEDCVACGEAPGKEVSPDDVGGSG